MDKDFFENFDKHLADFTGRLADPENVRGELVMTTGRTYSIDKVVQVGDAWVQIDGHDVHNEELPVSVVVPYHQVGHVAFVKRKQKPRSTGFAR